MFFASIKIGCMGIHWGFRKNILELYEEMGVKFYIDCLYTLCLFSG